MTATTAPRTSRTSLTDLIASARPNKLIAKLADDAAKAAHVAEADRAAGPNPFGDLVFSDAFAARLLEKLAPAAAADLRATLAPDMLKQVDDAVERHEWRHRWCECCHA